MVGSVRRVTLSILATLTLASGGACQPMGDVTVPDADAGPGSVVDAEVPPVADGGVAACASNVVARPGTVITRSGAVTGGKSEGVWAFKAIPYAAPPVGALRWKPPAAPACWEGERGATTLGPKCPQLEENEVVGSEDCLFLNVWAPEGAASGTAPVLVFIHGGGNSKGGTTDPLYDGAALAAKTGSVVVTLAYRLGALGYFAHPKLDEESPSKVSGNYGILDQVAALEWVKANVAGFGGDPKKVLLFGESGGGQNTLVHLVSPRSKGLFSAALVESGGVYRTMLAEAEDDLKGVVDGVDCSSAADVLGCMRSASVESLVLVPHVDGPMEKGGFRYGPVVDGVVLPANAQEMIARGEHNHVPFAIGTNADETSQMAAKVTTEAEYRAAVKAQYGPAADALLVLYPASAYASPRKALIQLTTDVTWTCPTRKIARAAAAHQSEPVYRYFFTWVPAGPAGVTIGATHGLELAFVFRNFHTFNGFTPAAADEKLADEIGGYWSRLASGGDPNDGTAVTWPKYDATDPYLELDRVVTAKKGLATAKCDAIDALASAPATN